MFFGKNLVYTKVNLGSLMMKIWEEGVWKMD